jgi:hypothetical protein
MKLNTSTFALASAGTAGLWFAICAAFVAMTPEATSALLSYVLHYNLDSVRPLTVGSFSGGLLLFSLGVGAFARLIAWLYNRLQGDSEVATQPRAAAR